MQGPEDMLMNKHQESQPPGGTAPHASIATLALTTTDMSPACVGSTRGQQRSTPSERPQTNYAGSTELTANVCTLPHRVIMQHLLQTHPLAAAAVGGHQRRPGTGWAAAASS